MSWGLTLRKSSASRECGCAASRTQVHENRSKRALEVQRLGRGKDVGGELGLPVRPCAAQQALVAEGARPTSDRRCGWNSTKNSPIVSSSASQSACDLLARARQRRQPAHRVPLGLAHVLGRDADAVGQGAEGLLELVEERARASARRAGAAPVRTWARAPSSDRTPRRRRARPPARRAGRRRRAPSASDQAGQVSGRPERFRMLSLARLYAPAARLNASFSSYCVFSAATTLASARVVVSPSTRPSAMSRSSRRMILPERVFGQVRRRRRAGPAGRSRRSSWPRAPELLRSSRRGGCRPPSPSPSGSRRPRSPCP